MGGNTLKNLLGRRMGGWAGGWADGRADDRSFDLLVLTLGSNPQSNITKLATPMSLILNFRCSAKELTLNKEPV